MCNTNKQFFVYTHARPSTNDAHGIFYVGKGNASRVLYIDRKYNNYHTNIVNKYGKENIVVRKLACESERHAFDLEVQMIAKLRSMGVKLSNMTSGGEGISGYELTDDARKNISMAQKIRFSSPIERKRMRDIAKKSRLNNPEISAIHSERMKGRTASVETRIKMSVSHKGREKTEEHRKNLSKSLTGKYVSIETRKKISESNRNRSPETRARMSEAQKNRPPISDATRAKLSVRSKEMWAKRKAKLDEVSL